MRYRNKYSLFEYNILFYLKMCESGYGLVLPSWICSPVMLMQVSYNQALCMIYFTVWHIRNSCYVSYIILYNCILTDEF